MILAVADLSRLAFTGHGPLHPFLDFVIEKQCPDNPTTGAIVCPLQK